MSNKVYFEIQSTAPTNAAKFYQEVFGWELQHDINVPIEYWRINGSDGAILQRPVPTPPVGTGINAFVCSFEVSRFDETAKKIMDLGGIVALSKFAIPGKCWQRYFVDPDHNTFGIFEADESAQ